MSVSKLPTLTRAERDALDASTNAQLKAAGLPIDDEFARAARAYTRAWITRQKRDLERARARIARSTES